MTPVGLVSVVVATPRHQDLPDGGIERLTALSASAGPEWELLVVQRYERVVEALLAGRVDRVRRLPSCRVSLAPAYCDGIAAARGEVVVCMDARAVGGDLGPLVQACRDPDVGLAGATVLRDGVVVAGGLVGVPAPGGRALVVDPLRGRRAGAAAALAGWEPSAPSGALFAARRAVLLEAPEPEGEDLVVDVLPAALWVRTRGLRVVHVADAHVDVDPDGPWTLDVRRARPVLTAGAPLLAGDRRAGERMAGGRLNAARTEPGGAAADVVLHGNLAGVDGWCAEGRDLAAGLRRAHRVAAVAQAWTAPHADGPTLASWDWARSGTAHVLLPGANPPGAAGPRIVRAGRRSLTRRVGGVDAAWVVDEASRRAAIAAGLLPAQVHVVPPRLPAIPGGAGDGIVVLLPGDDLRLAEAVARAVRAAARERRVVLAWPVATPALVGLARGWCPAAEVCASGVPGGGCLELLRDAAVVVAVDPLDDLQRAPLYAAAAGAIPVVPPGPVADILGPDAVVVREPGEAALVEAVEEAAARAIDGRATRRLRVVDASRGPLPELPDRPGGPRTLMVVPEVPDHRRSAGDLRWEEMLRAFRRMGHGVTVWSYVGNVAGGAARALTADGVEVRTGDEGILLADVARRGYDLALLGPHSVALQRMRDVRAGSPDAHVVVDSVDVHFRRMARLATLTGKTWDSARAERERALELLTYRRGDAVIAVTEEEAALLAPLVAPVSVAIVGLVHPVIDAPPPLEGRRGALFVGSFRHPPNVDAVEYLAAEIAPRLALLGYDEPVAVAGAGMPPWLAALARDAGLEVLGFVASVEDELARCRLSIAPLRYGGGMKGKVAQALAVGVPVVGTRAAAEGFDRPERGIVLGDDPDSFAAAMVDLSRDNERWARLSAGGLELVGESLGPAQCEAALRTLEATTPAVSSGRAP